jgi:hypothetical protein
MISTYITAIIILTIVWGGFAYFVRKAFLFEKKKRLEENGS